jgi:iron complex transport system ATP-binding protein
LASQGKTVVMVLHDLNQAFRYADHIAVMKAGQLVMEGSPEVVAEPSMLREVFSIDCSVMRDPEADTPMIVIKG